MYKIDHGLNLQWLTAGLIWFATWNGIILIVNLCYLSSLARGNIHFKLWRCGIFYMRHGNDDGTKNFSYRTLDLSSSTSATDRMFTPNFLKSIKCIPHTTKSLQIISNICVGMHLKLYLRFVVSIIQNVKRFKVAGILIGYAITELWINAINITFSFVVTKTAMKNNHESWKKVIKVMAIGTFDNLPVIQLSIFTFFFWVDFSGFMLT